MNAHTDTILSLRGEKLSFTEIAARLGVTRNVVAGVVHRQGHCTPKRVLSPEELAAKNARKAAADRKRYAARRAARLRDLEAAGTLVISGRLRRRPIKQPKMKEAAEAAPIHIALFDLTESTCRFPYGEAAPFTFCGCASVEGKPYCQPHMRLTTREGD